MVRGEVLWRAGRRRAEDGLLWHDPAATLQSEMLAFREYRDCHQWQFRSRCGIEFDLIGRALAYHFSPPRIPATAPSACRGARDLRVPAEVCAATIYRFLSAQAIGLSGCGARHGAHLSARADI